MEPSRLRSDQELVEAVLAGDRSSYGQLVERYERAVRAVAMRVLGDPDAAQDATQEALVIAYRRLSTLRNRAMFGLWLLRITRREAVRLGRRRVKTEPLHDRPDPHADGRLAADAEELLHAVDRLPGHERLAVMLRYFEGQGVAEIARVTGRPLGTVTKQLSRAHERLRKWLKEEREP